MRDIGRLPIGLALSGGGVRAMAFHCGVLRWLAQTGRMEDVAHVSSVSGGTLAAGLVLALNGWRWPSSDEYLKIVQPQFERVLTTGSLAATVILRLIWPQNWRFIFSRANLVSQAIEHDWGIEERLSHLPEKPVWSINGTTAETGRRFRFKQDRCGDYEIGYIICSDGGAPLGRIGLPILGVRRVKRLLDIVMEQARALRIRALATFLERNPMLGAYAQIGADPNERLHRYESLHPSRALQLLQKKWLRKAEIAAAASYGTTLNRLQPAWFQLLEMHGYESVKWNEVYFGGRYLEHA